jgi:cytidylate kinase
LINFGERIMDYISIAVDGPAGAGKSSVSKAVAKKLGFVYIDTGAMYRTVALNAIRRGIDCRKEPEKVVEALKDAEIEIKYLQETQHIYLNGEDVSGEIRTEQVSVGASDVAVISEVRKKLVSMQQEMAKNANVIMDGRDICNHVLPKAQVKIFLTASVDERASRRFNEMTEKGVKCDFEELKREIEYRDRNDSEREEAPLRQAPDAVLLDTTGMTFDEVVKKVTEMAEAVM